MANQIHVTPAKLISTASAFDGTNNTIHSLTNQMTEIVTSLTGNIWTGDAQQAYLGKFNSLQADINKIHKMINEHVMDLKQMAQEYERAEQTSISQAQALKTNVIV